jgi:DNA-binding transcriptional LysR family regulator
MDRLAAMEAFVRVVETGSFSAAAKLLRVGQPAISKTVAQLEARLGVRLLLRSSRRLAPTEAGHEFFERARRTLEAADAAEHGAREAGTGLSGRLRFAAAVTFARLHILPRLPQFLASHPSLAIDAILDDRNVDLIEEGIDVALRLGELAEPSLTARRIARQRRLVVGTPAYFARAGAPRTPSELATHAAVIDAQGGGGADWNFNRGGVEQSITLTARVRLTAAEGVRECVLAGLGLCVATEWMFAPELASGRVREVMTDWHLPAIDLWAAFPAGRRVSAQARAFASFVESQMSESEFAG